MKSMSMSSIALLTLAAVWGSVGCGQSGAENDVFEYGSYSLSSDEGGFSSANDVNAFADEESLESFQEVDENEVSPADWTLNPSSEIAEGTPVRRYYIRVAWGHLYPRPDSTTVTDFSGEISSNIGAIKILRTLRFEGQDSLLPRTDAKAVGFISHTRPHNDGLLLTVIAPETNAAGNPATLTINAGPAQKTYQLSDFANGMVDISDVDSQGNQLLVSGSVAPAEGCGRGFIAGRWQRMNDRGGIFSGRWMQVDGQPHGRLAGIWGRSSDGGRVFYGVYINAQEQLGGILRGTYEPLTSSSELDSSAPVGGNGGLFKGEWVSNSGEHKGKIRGAYVVGEPGKGHFQAGWAERGCDEAKNEATPMSAGE